MKKYIIFMCNNQNMAIHIDATERILLLDTITMIPDTSNYVKGVMDYNGEVIPVVDLKERLFRRTYEPTEDTKVIVALWKEHKIGLIADDVITVKDFSSQQLNQDDGQEKKSIQAIVRMTEGIISVLAVDHLFSSEGDSELLSIIHTFAKEEVL